MKISQLAKDTAAGFSKLTESMGLEVPNVPQGTELEISKISDSTKSGISKLMEVAIQSTENLVIDSPNSLQQVLNSSLPISANR